MADISDKPLVSARFASKLYSACFYGDLDDVKEFLAKEKANINFGK